MVELEREYDGVTVRTRVDVVLELLLLLHQLQRRFGRSGLRRNSGILPEVDDGVAASGDNGVVGRVDGQRPDSVLVVVQRALGLALVRIPDFHEAVATSTSKQDTLLGCVRLGRHVEPSHLEDVVRMAFEGSQAGVIGQVPDLDGLVTAAGQRDAPPGHRSSVALQSWNICRGKFDRPDAPPMPLQDALNLASLKIPNLYRLVLRGRSEQFAVGAHVDGIDVLVMGLSAEDGAGGFVRVGRGLPRDHPLLDIQVPGARQEIRWWVAERILKSIGRFLRYDLG